MTNNVNYRKIAIDVGNLLKYDAVVNEINRQAKAIFHFQMEEFPNNDITSSRARLIYNWILSLAKQKMESSARNHALISFCKSIAPEEFLSQINKIIQENGLIISGKYQDGLNEFLSRNLHAMIHTHCKKYFCQGNYFHAVFEACKIYNKEVKTKSQSMKDGYKLMMDIFSVDNGVLKITPCQTDTDKNVQEGIKFLSAGLMQAMRNPTAHEPALHWPIRKEDCLDMLSFLSFLFRQLDSATYYNPRDINIF